MSSSSLSGAGTGSNSLPGLASGLDTTSIVEALMKVERRSYNRVSEKVETEKVKLQAYQSVNSFLASFKDSVSNLAKASLWNSKASSSSNEASLTATASQSAAEGSYSLRVAQLATSTQYMSAGYSSQTSTLISSASGASKGSITLESSKARVDTSAKLEELNGGKGVYRGSVRITDASGATTTVDLSACETIDQVVTTLNNAAGVQIKASIRTSDDGKSGDRLEIVDSSGGSGSLRIQNVGQGTTATDLGIAGASQVVNGVNTLVGSSIHFLSNSTAISSLRDGLGIEMGIMCLSLNTGAGDLDIYVDLSDAETAGDIVNGVNAAIKAAAAESGNADKIGDLKLGFNADKNGFAFTGGKAGAVYTVTEVYETDANGQAMLSQPKMTEELGLFGTYSVANDGDSFGGKRLLGDMNSPILANLSGANKTGIGSESSLPTAPAATLDANTKLSALNGGAGLGDLSNKPIQVFFTDAGITRVDETLLDANRLRALTSNPDATLGDLLDYVNGQFAKSGNNALNGIEIKIDSSGKGVYLDGLLSTSDYQFAGSLITSLGLVHAGSGDASQGWGSTITGSLSPAADALYANTDMGNGTSINPTTKLSGLYNSATSANFTASEMDALLQANDFSVTVDGHNFTVDLSGLDSNATLDELCATIQASLKEQCANAGLSSSPYLDISQDTLGFVWCNVDLTSDFSVSGTFADAFGVDKTYVGDTSLSTVSTTTQKNLNPVTAGTSTPRDIAGSQLLNTLNAGAGLQFTGDKLTLSFGAAGSEVTVSVTRDEILNKLASMAGSVNAATVDDYVGALNSLFADAIAADGTLNGSGAQITFGYTTEGIQIVSADGTVDGERIVLGGGMASAASTGLAGAEMEGGTSFASPDVVDIRGADVTPATVSGLGYINMKVGNTDIQLNTNGLDQYSTLNDLIYSLNKQLSDLGYSNMSFGISDSGSGIAFSNGSDSDVTFKYDAVSSLASDLGLTGKAADKTDVVVGANSHANGSSLNRNYIARSTKLSTLNNGEGMDKGVIKITNASGAYVQIDLSDSETIGEVLDAINGLLSGVKARINDAGDGILIEQTDNGKGNITVTSTDGSDAAKHLGIEGASTAGEDGVQRLDGSMKTVIEVGSNDTLTDVMNRIAALDKGYKASIINDGTGTNSYRLSIASGSTGSGHDFIIDSDLLAMQQVTRGQDSMVLYGNPDSGMSPVALKSATNSNNQAILGLTLELNATSDTYTTINVTTDTSKVVEELENMVQCYNDLSDLITYLDAYDPSTEEKGILYGDTTVRNLMDQLEAMFYQVYNPNNMSYGDIAASGVKSTWTWMDLGINFSTNNSNEDGESGYWYSRMELDTAALSEMVSNNWDDMQKMLCNTVNVADSTRPDSVKATAGFNFQKEYDADGNLIGEYQDPNQAINNDKSSSNFGTTNGFTANKTIAEGENQYTVYFQGTVNLDRVSIYHPNSADYPASEYALKDFLVEYLDPTTGNWEELREVSGNSASSTIIGANNLAVGGIRITANSTNASDGKFRLLDVQCLESNGLANNLSKLTNSLTDVVDGYFTLANAEVETSISELQEQLTKLNERLDAKEAALWSKYNNMESVLSQLNSQSSTLTSLISSLGNNSNSKK